MEEIKISFLSEENIVLIKEIITDHLVSKYDLDMSVINNIDLDGRLRGIMETLINKLEIKNLEQCYDLPSKIVFINKQVIKISINGFYKLIKIQLSKKNLNNTPILNNNHISNVNNSPDLIGNSLNNNHITNINNNPDSISNSLNNNEEEFNFSKRLEKLNEERQNDNIQLVYHNKQNNTQFNNNSTVIDSNPRINKPYINHNDMELVKENDYKPKIQNIKSNELVQSMINFEEKNNEFKNIDNEFEKRINLLKKQREDTFKTSLIKTDTNETIKIPIVDTKLNHLENNLYTDTNLNKIREPVELMVNNKNTNYKELITPNVSKIITQKKIISDIPKIEKPRFPPEIKLKNININTKSKLIIINANDRNWSSEWTKDSIGNDILSERTNANRYNFTIKFGRNSSENVLTYIEHQFKNIFSIELSDVILSTHDNPSIVGINKNEVIHKDITDENGTPDEKKKCMNNKYIYYNIYTYPYLLIKISEFNGNLLTSNKCDNDGFVSRLVIGKNYVNNSFCKNNDIVQGYILMKPLVSINNCSLDFKPTPLSSLDKLTISLIKPNGDLYGSENKWNIDNINITGIEITDSSIDLYVDPPFHHSMYLCGDSLKIKCFEFLICQENITQIKKKLTHEEQSIKRFFNNEHIKYIKKTKFISYHEQNFINTEKKDCLVEFNNVISLGLPVKIDSKCNFEYEFNEKGKWSVGGCLINVNIQPTYTLNITYQDNNLDKKNLCIDK